MNFKALVIVAMSTCGTLFSQVHKQDKVLFTLDGTPYYSEEFKRIYNKNLDLIQDPKQRDVDQYLDLFVLYKLKVSKAYDLKLHEGKSYINELKTNRDQLAERYLTDESLIDNLVVEAYNRSLKEINADHILFSAKPFASAADTLKVYNKALTVRNEILSGADFNEMAKKYSDDPSAKENGGALGYFSAFKMVYPFESGAYNTAIGQVSMPIRSQFGYHLIKVNEIRENRGEVIIAHLMLLKSTDNDVEKNTEIHKRIKELDAQLKKGANFEELVAQYSEDTNTAKVGGILAKFRIGVMNEPEFEETAFNLEIAGDISAPVETTFGWHLIKLIQKDPLPTLQESKIALENKVKRDSRSRMINEQLVKKIKQRFSVVEDHKLKKQVFSLVDLSFYKNSWKRPVEDKQYQKPLLTINKDRVATAMDFLKYIEKNQQAYRGVEPLSKAVDLAYEKFLESELKSYYMANLESEFPEFDHTVTEYREGLLLFELMETEIWNKAKVDTLGYTAYYEKHKQKYKQKQRLDLAIYHFEDEKVAKRTFKRWLKKPNLATAIPAVVKVESGLFDLQSAVVTERHIPTTQGVYQNPKDNREIIVVKEVIPEQILEMESVRSQLLEEYQDSFEAVWLENLKKEKKIEVNRSVLEEVKQELSKG